MKEKILLELQIEIEKAIINFENIFNTYNGDFENFVKENYQPFKNSIAKSTTDAIHQLLVNNLSSDKNLLNKIVKMNSESFEILIIRISQK